MELHALQRRGGAGQRLVAHAHDLAILRGGGHLQLRRQAVARDGQRVVADDAELLGQVAKDPMAIGSDGAGLAVHLHARTHHLAAQRRAHGLVPQAHTKKRQLAGEVADGLDADAGLGGRARSGRQYQAVGPQGGDARDGDLVVAEHAHVLAELTEILHQVVGEAVVVVDHQQHGRSILWVPRVAGNATLSSIPAVAVAGGAGATRWWGLQAPGRREDWFRRMACANANRRALRRMRSGRTSPPLWPAPCRPEGVAGTVHAGQPRGAGWPASRPSSSRSGSKASAPMRLRRRSTNASTAMPPTSSAAGPYHSTQVVGLTGGR